MAIDLLELAQTYLTPEIVQRAAGYVQESPAATQQAFAGIVPTLIGALAAKSSTTDGAQSLARLIDTEHYDGSLLGNVSSLFGGGVATQSALGTGKSLLESLFGSKIGEVTSELASFAGVRGSSMTQLLALAAPLVMHLLGRQRASIGTSAASLAGLLDAQRGSVTRLLPAGLGSVLGWPWLSSGVAQAGAAATGVAQQVGRQRWLLPLLLLGVLVAAALAWLSWPTASVREATRRISELQLPGGARISVPEGGFNFSLVNWLAGTEASVPKRFVFDDLNFERASTRLTPDSIATVDTLVAVLKAYPPVTVTLEGHTDSTGDPAANKALSVDRALAVKELMVKGGIEESRIQSDGWGQEKPIAPNDTEAGRAKNRRLELVVTKR